MKRDLHENFEEFLKRSADNLRMKAPDRVWQKLSGELKKERRRFGLGLSAFFLLASVLSYFTIGSNTRPFQFTKTIPDDELMAPVSAQESTAGSEKTEAPVIPISRALQTRNRTKAVEPHQIPAQTITDDVVTATETMHPAQQSTLADEPFEPTIVDSYPVEENETSKVNEASEDFLRVSSSPNSTPWTIESATNSFLEKRFVRKSRFQTQFHFAPTISYRKLTENKSYLRNSNQALVQPNYSALYNSVNSMVTHKPDIGFELGVTEKYSLSQNVRIRAGLQFNVNRYDIKAFHAPYALATIALNNRRSARVDSLYTITNYSNVDVSRNNKGSWLQNFSFQVSAPIGVELSLKGNEKMKFGIAATVQPTYVLGDRAYMITSDYKSYTQVPWLLRRWNVNTALETFVMYNTGKTTWQVGPQVRYQLLSSFITNYPVKENLFDFGLRIGVSVNK